MAWQETCPVEERIRFVEEHRRCSTFVELCRRFGVSRKTGYKWLRRHAKHGLAGLEDSSRASWLHPNATVAEVEQLIVDYRLAHRTWGARKIRSWLERCWPERTWPCLSTVNEVLRRHGLTRPLRPRRRAPRATEPLSHALGPNDVWSIDFKGWFRTGDGNQCGPLTVLDAFSRYAFDVRALEKSDTEHVKPTLERCFREYGLPLAMRSDNGPPFGSTARAGLTPLAVWLVKLGVRPERIEPGHPEQNGRHERFHRTLKQDAASPPAKTLGRQQAAFDRFRQTYNLERPHEALGMRTPAEAYRRSERLLPRTLDEPEYPASADIRRVRGNGEIKWAGETVYVTQALAGELVGLERLDDRHWSVRFGPLRLGVVDEWKRAWAD